MTLTLWDFIDTATPAAPAQPKPPIWTEPTGRGFPIRVPAIVPSPSPPPQTSPIAPPPSERPEFPSPASMEERYETVTRLMLKTYGIRVRKWRTSMSGVAWCLTYRDGSVKRLIEAPRPRGPMSAAIFLHEIGHHAIGFNVYKPRCLEEFHAWRWSLEAMQAHGLNITDQVRWRMHASLWYAVAKALRRGIESVPTELEPFLERPRRPRRGIAS